jgi:ribosomal protein S2
LKAKFKNKIMSETVNKKEIAKQYVKASVHYGHPPKEWNQNGTLYFICKIWVSYI